MAITNGYCSLAQVKAALRIPTADTVDDSLLEMAVESASRLIDSYTGRRFYQSGTVTRYYAPQFDDLAMVDDIAGTAVTIQSSTGADGVYDVTFAVTDYQLEPLNSISEGVTLPFTRIRAVGDYAFTTASGETTLKVTAVYGFPSTPTEVTQATVIQASRIFKRLDSPLGVAGFGDMGVMRVSAKVDPDVAMLVHPFKRAPGVG